jgi:hypothetical protein
MYVGAVDRRTPVLIHAIPLAPPRPLRALSLDLDRPTQTQTLAHVDKQKEKERTLRFDTFIYRTFARREPQTGR